MLRIHQVESLDHPALAPYRTMRRPDDHVQQGIFVAEGEKVVCRLLGSTDFGVVSLLIPPGWLNTHGSLVEARTESIEIFIADKKVLEALIGFSMFQGVLAVGRIPVQPSLADLLDNSTQPRLFVAADALANAANMGALVRNCVAFGVQALLVGETCSPPWLRRSVRSSMGTIFDLPVLETESLAETLQGMRARGIRIVAAHPHLNGLTLAQAHFRGDTCIVVGSEGDGIAPQVLEACDDHVAIPMQLGVSSINVTSASAVFLYEANRQRGNG